MDDLLHCNRLQCRKSLGLEGDLLGLAERILTSEASDLELNMPTDLCSALFQAKLSSQRALVRSPSDGQKNE